MTVHQGWYDRFPSTMKVDYVHVISQKTSLLVGFSLQNFRNLQKRRPDESWGFGSCAGDFLRVVILKYDDTHTHTYATTFQICSNRFRNWQSFAPICTSIGTKKVASRDSCHLEDFHPPLQHFGRFRTPHTPSRLTSQGIGPTATAESSLLKPQGTSPSKLLSRLPVLHFGQSFTKQFFWWFWAGSKLPTPGINGPMATWCHIDPHS